MKRSSVVDYPTLIKCGWALQPIALSDIEVSRTPGIDVPVGNIDPQKWKPAIIAISPEGNKHKVSSAEDETYVTSVTALSMAETFIETELRDCKIVDKRSGHAEGFENNRFTIEDESETI